MTRRMLAVLFVPALFAMGMAEPARDVRKLVLIAGKQSHGPGDHEFRAGCLLLKKCLAAVPDLQVEIVSNGWPEDTSIFGHASAIVCYADGGGGHPFIQGDRSKLIGDLAKKGVGL